MTLSGRLLSLCTIIAESGLLLNLGTTAHATNHFGLGVGSGLVAQNLLSGNLAGLYSLLTGKYLLSGDMPAWYATQLGGMIGVGGFPYLLY